MNDGKFTTRESGRDTLTLIAAVAITLLGIGVVAGWHLHVRVLVQVIPGAIPMQYNTALCFILLGASAFMRIVGRGPKPVPVLGALFVALMAALVIFEYVTGINLGIDTALFYPWDQTLSAYPGRMALTSAISFLSAGGGLLLLTLRWRSLAIFAIAHVLPLSLGLISALGYLVGVTSVLPFHLGSQMALHTALAFLAYASVMIVHAWRLAPFTEDGLPVWRSDNSERKRAEEALRESEEGYRLLFESNPNPVWVYDLETLKFLTVNEAAIQHYGYSREEFLTMTIKDIRPSEDVSALLDNVAKVSTAAIDQAGMWKHQKKDGQVIDVEIISHQIAFAGRNAELVLANDITERRRAEKLAEEQKLELEKLTANLTAANKELEAFTYSVSHDLRAPLRAVDGFSRILLEDYADNLDSEGRRVLGVIRTNTQNMGRLIDDLLAFSRFGRKQIEPSTIDVGELVRDVFVQFDHDNGDKAPRLEIKQAPVAYGDRALMRQVFVNLLSNAAKYSQPAASPVIEVGGCSEKEENIYYVKDNGVGFDMQYVNKLFGVFQRLHSPEEFEGTGVGLAIVRRIVERHGGRVWAEGKKGEGATFYFTLPKNRENHNEQFAE